MSLEEYLSSRAKLINEERSLRRDYSYITNLTPEEKDAETVVRMIRAEEAKTIWSGEHEEIPHLFPGMEFLTARKIIEGTKLFKIVRKMPKGGLLHVHLDATVDAEILLRIALEHPEIHVRSPIPFANDLHTRPLPEFRALPASQFGSAMDIASVNYAGGTWVPLKDARKAFSLGEKAFDDWMIGAITINPTEAYKTHNTVTKIWQKFRSVFIVSTGLIRYAPIFEEYIYQFLKSSVEDGIMYVEARVNFWYKTMIDANGDDSVTHAEWLDMFDRAQNRIKQELKKQGRSDEFYGAKIIYTTLRFIDEEELEWALADCLDLKKKYPHIIAGFDLVGDENVLYPLTKYLKPLLKFQDTQKEQGIEIPFVFHAGETLGDGDSVDDNLYDAILLGTKRIGHGFSLAKHPHLMKTCRERGIAVEVCPISNEILRLTSSMPMHPLPVLLNNGVPVALNSDDPAIFGNLNLSYDFFQVLVSSEVSGLITLAVTARDSIKFSLLDELSKKELMDIWERRWNEFVDELRKGSVQQ